MTDPFGQVVYYTYAYDLRGNRQTLQSQATPSLENATYTYDTWDRLVQVTTEETTVNYTYNGDNLLVEREENGSITRYYYDGANIIAEGSVTGATVTLKARYLRGLGLIAQQDQSNQLHYYLHNGHGDVIELRDSTGDILNSYTYDIWGKPLQVVEQVHNPFRYAGELWDETVNLQYLRARWYDPSMGRFINEDTYQGELNHPLSLNWYTYVHNNPLIYIDPSGHWCESVDGRYARPGSCSSSTSTWSPDYQNHGADILNMGKVVGTYDYYSDYSLDELNFDWAFYGDAVYRNAPTGIQNSLRHMAFHNAIHNDGLTYFVAGLEFGTTFISGPSRGFTKIAFSRKPGSKEKVNLQVINDNYLKRRGINAHKVKLEYLGDKAPIALYDFCK